MAVLKTVSSWNGKAVNDGVNYRAAVLNAVAQPTATPVFIDRADDDPDYSGTFTVSARNVAVAIQIANYANRHALEEQLRRWFKRGTRGRLVVVFADDGLSYQLSDCVVQSLADDEGYPGRFIAILQCGQTAWIAVNPDTDTWNVSSTGGTKNISVGGSDITALSFSMAVSAATSAGYLYQNVLQIPNVPGVDIGMRTWMVTINHAALVSGGKSLASGYDLMLVTRGTKLKRWVVNPNNASTKIFFILDVGPGYILKLKTAVLIGGSVTRLYFDLTHADTKAYFSALPTSGILYHGTEWFSYSQKNKTGFVAVAARSVYGTTAQAHSVGDLFQFIEWPVVLMYGKAGATDPASGDSAYDDEKPVINLTSSTNTSHVYDNGGLFYDVNPGRAGQWRITGAAPGDVSDAYLIKQFAASGDPALGTKAGSYKSGNLWQPSSVSLKWTLRSTTKISTLAMTGQKYRSDSVWIDNAKIQSSVDGKTWVDVRSEATPGSAASWTAWTLTTTSLASGTKYVRLLLDGLYPGGKSRYVAFEGLTATVVYDSAALPTLTFLGEKSNATLALTMTNKTNDNGLDLDFPLLLNKVFAVDGEAYTVKYDTVSAHDALTLNDGGREIFIGLEPGITNVLEIVSNGVGTMVITLSWYKRRFG
jgi:hypothetical protein